MAPPPQLTKTFYFYLKMLVSKKYKSVRPNFKVYSNASQQYKKTFNPLIIKMTKDFDLNEDNKT